jgi:hypothetical protein
MIRNRDEFTGIDAKSDPSLGSSKTRINSPITSMGPDPGPILGPYVGRMITANGLGVVTIADDAR